MELIVIAGIAVAIGAIYFITKGRSRKSGSKPSSTIDRTPER